MRYEIFSNNNTSPLKISCIGFSEDRNVTRFGPGQRNVYIIHYVVKGKGYYNDHLVTEGQGFLIFPGQFEEYFADMADPWTFLWVISDDDAIKEIFGRYNADPNTLIFNYDSIPVAKEIAKKIMANNSKIFDSLELLELFLHILNSHIYNKVSSARKPNSEIYLDFCLKYIETNVYKKITINELTTLLGISQPYLHKIFNRSLHMSPKQYITWYKISYAKKLLLETDLSIAQIAHSVGYTDELAFSKMFSLKESISPKKYREINKGPVHALNGYQD